MMDEHTLRITEKAKRVFRESLVAEGLEPNSTFLRIGAKPGGCSGWTFLLETTKGKKSTDDQYCYDDITMVIDRRQLQTVIGSVEVDYKDDNLVEQGFVFKRLGSGQLCGCGESFTPLGSNTPLGWDHSPLPSS